MKQLEYCYCPLDGMLAHCRVDPPLPPPPPPRSSMSSVPICTPECRETMWSKVSCVRKQHSNEETNKPSNLPMSDGKSNALTTTSLRLNDLLILQKVSLLFLTWPFDMAKSVSSILPIMMEKNLWMNFLLLFWSRPATGYPSFPHDIYTFNFCSMYMYPGK